MANAPRSGSMSTKDFFDGAGIKEGAIFSALQHGTGAWDREVRITKVLHVSGDAWVGIREEGTGARPVYIRWSQVVAFQLGR